MMPEYALVFDLETIPDIHMYQKITGHSSDMFEIDMAKETFPKICYHRIICGGLSLIRLSDGEAGSDCITDEKKFLTMFIELINDFKNPTLVSFNGYSFDLPLIQYKLMQHRLPAIQLMDKGQVVKDKRFNSYRNRYHDLHIDLCDQMANHTSTKMSLHEMSCMMGLPGKKGIGGDQVFSEWKKGNLQSIQDYCMIDILNTSLLFLRYLEISFHFESNQMNQIIEKYLASVLKSKLRCSLIEEYIHDYHSSNFCST